MKYQIISYDPEKLVILVKVSETDDFQNVAILPISVINIQNQTQLENAIYYTWRNSLPARRRATITQDVETFITTHVNQPTDFTIPVQQLNLVQNSQELAQTGTDTTWATVI